MTESSVLYDKFNWVNTGITVLIMTSNNHTMGSVINHFLNTSILEDLFSYILNIMTNCISISDHSPTRPMDGTQMHRVNCNGGVLVMHTCVLIPFRFSRHPLQSLSPAPRTTEHHSSAEATQGWSVRTPIHIKIRTLCWPFIESVAPNGSLLAPLILVAS